MEAELLELAKPVPWATAIALVSFFLYKSGLLSALAGKILGTGPAEDRVKTLEDFKEEAETNHWHDIERLMNQMEKIQSSVNDIDKRVVRIETKLNGQLK